MKSLRLVEWGVKNREESYSRQQSPGIFHLFDTIFNPGRRSSTNLLTRQSWEVWRGQGPCSWGRSLQA